MANDTVTTKLIVDDLGTIKKLTSEAEKLYKTLNKAGEAAGNTFTPKSVAAARAAQQRDLGRQSGLARGIAGDTGASGRDFAKQAEGLGGLVRLYATIAANVFAATAAFTALSKAADTTNMVRGLDQLGAASGRGLGSLSKRLYDVTEGAVSMREALEATAKASSAGLTNKQILELGDVAKRASQALGVNMTDALSRLSRGISKIEPELLDELGIYVKIDKAASDYARTLGKTTSSLTDFERRQAFANAVLEQGKKKFGDLDIDANPYNKLSASLANVAQKSLEVINIGLGPLVKLLSESPVALSTVLAGLVTLLVRQAIPAIGSWRMGLKASAEDAAKAAEKLNNSFPERFVEKVENLFKIPNIKNQIAKVDGEIARLSNKKITVPVDIPKGIADKAALDVSRAVADTQRLSEINKLLETRNKYVETGFRGSRKLSEEQINAYKQEAEYLKAVQAELKNKIALETALTNRRQLTQKLDEAQAKAEVVAGQPTGKLSPEAVAIRQAENARLRYEKIAAVSAAAETARVLGVRSAWEELNKTVEEKGITGVSKYTTIARGGLAAVASRVGGILSAFGNLSFYFAAALAALEAINFVYNKFISGNARQTEERVKAFEMLNEAGLAFSRTLENISKKDPLSQLSAESLQAKATAFNELTTSFKASLDSVLQEDKLSNVMDRFIDGFKIPFGQDLLSKSVKISISQIDKALSTSSVNADNFYKSISKLAGVRITNLETLKDVLGSSPETFKKLMPAVQEELEKINREYGKTASAVSGVNTAFETASKTLDNLMISFLPTDNVAKFGIDLLNLGKNLSVAFRDTTAETSVLVESLKDADKLRLFGPETFEYITKNKDKIQQTAILQQRLNTYIDERNTREKELSAILNSRTSSTSEMLSAKQELKRIAGEKQAVAGIAVAANDEMKSYLSIFRKGQSDTFIRGAQFIEASLAAGFAKGAILVSQAYAALLGNSPQGIAEQARLKQQELGVQANLIKVQLGLIEATQQNTLRLEEANLQKAKEDKLAKNDVAGAAEIQKIIDRLRTVLNTGLYQGAKAFSNFRKDIRSEDAATQNVAGLVSSSVYSKVGLDAKLSEIGGQSKAVDIKAKDDERRARTEQAIVDIKVKNLDLDKKLLDTARSYFTILSDQQLAVIQANENLEVQNKQLEEIYKLGNDIASVQTVINQTSDATQRLQAEERKARLLKEFFNLQIRQATELDIQNKIFKLQEIDRERQVSQYRIDQASKFAALTQSISEGILASREQEVEYLSRITLLTESDTIAAKGRLEVDKERLSLQSRLSQIALERASKNADFNREIQAAEVSKADPSQLKNIQDRQKESEAYYTTLINAENYLSTQRQNSITQMTAFNEQLAKSKDFTSALTDAFGKVGQAIGNVVEQLQITNTKQEEFARKRIKLEEALRNASTDEEAINIIKEKYALENRFTNSQLNDNAKLLGSAKTLFKEKTGAYKLITNLERALHVMRLANMVKEIAASFTQTTAEVAQSGIRAQAKGTEAVVAALTIPPPFGWVAAAITAAMVASLIGKSVTKGGGVPTGMGAEDAQKVQGTGQTYVNGQLTNRGGGALGSNTEKADSIGKSLEMIQQHTFEYLEYSNDMLKALKGIQKNTEGLSAILLQSGVNLAGIKAEGSKIKSVEYTIDSIGSKIARDLFGGGSGISKIADKAAEKIFGGKVTKETIDSGITARGNIFNTTANTYANVQTTKSGGLFRASKTSVDTQVGELAGVGSEIITEVFKSMGSAVLESAKVFGKDLTAVSDVLNNFNVDFKVSLQGLDADGVTKALEAEFSVWYNILAEKIYPELQKFRKPGEEFGETLTRLVRNVQSTGLALESVGLSIGNINAAMTEQESFLEANVRITESLIDKVGDVDSFISKVSFFGDNFLTKEQQLAPIRNRVSKELDRLSKSTENVGLSARIASVSTREGFADIIQSLDLTSEAGQQLFTDLMNLAPAFAQITDEIKSLSEKDYLKALREQQIQILTLEGKGIEALALSRQKEIEALSDPRLINGQMYIWRLQDNLKVRDQEIEILKLLGKASEALALSRQKELDALTDPRLMQGQEQIYALQDAVKIRELEISVMTTLGYTYDALIARRQLEYAALTDEERALRVYIDAIVDKNNTDNLRLEILELEGNATEALVQKRTRELRGLSALDQILKLRIYRLQDEKKLTQAYASQQIQIQELLGNSIGALSLKRQQELETIDPQLRAYQRYIYALEDEKTLKDSLVEAYEKQRDSLKNVISGVKDSIKALQEYKASLLQSDKSILTPAQKYAAAKQRALQLAAESQGPAVTEEQIARRDRALSELPSATDAWLEASRTLYASSESYVSDFNMVLSILDKTSGILDGQKSDAQKQLDQMTTQSSLLGLIQENTKSFSDLLKEYLAARDVSAGIGNSLSGTFTPNTDATSPAVAQVTAGASGVLGAADTIIRGIAGYTTTLGQARTALTTAVQTDLVATYNFLVSQGITSAMTDAILGLVPGTSLATVLRMGLPAFATGGLASGVVSVGEQGREIVDFQTPGRVYSANDTSAMIGNAGNMISLLAEIKEQLAELRKEQKEQTGHIVGSTIESANKTVVALEDSSKTESEAKLWTNRNILKIA